MLLNYVIQKSADNSLFPDEFFFNAFCQTLDWSFSFHLIQTKQVKNSFPQTNVFEKKKNAISKKTFSKNIVSFLI